MLSKGDGSSGSSPAGDQDDRAAFDVVRRGYRTDQVDTRLRELGWRLEVAERERDESRDRARALLAALEEARSRADAAPDTFGVRAEKILRMAEHDARRQREQAEHEAAQIRDVAHEEAERTVLAARADASRIRAEAEAASAQVQAELAGTLHDADRRADSAASMHEHVLGLRSAVRGEVARLYAALGAELRVLDAAPVTEPSPVPAQGGPGRSDAARSDAARSDAARSDAARSDAARSDAARPDAARSDADRANAARADTARADAARADAARADAARADAARADAARADAARADAARADAAWPDAARADAASVDPVRADTGPVVRTPVTTGAAPSPSPGADGSSRAVTLPEQRTRPEREQPTPAGDIVETDRRAG